MNKNISKISSSIALTACMGFLILGSGTASADVALCQKAIDVTELATQGAEFLGRNATKDEANLLSKLASAELKVAQEKYADAVAKLVDYQSAVISMADAAKPKLSAVDAYGEDLIADGIGGLDSNAVDAIAACSL